MKTEQIYTECLAHAANFLGSKLRFIFDSIRDVAQPG